MIVMFVLLFDFFFFKQKTAYEMRISDWSSDVCSSDLEVLDLLEDKSEPALLLILDGVTDPHNLGACLRTADAAGVHAVIAPRDKAVGMNSTVQRVACGAAETVPYIMVTNLARTLRQLKERDVWLVVTDDQATTGRHQIGRAECRERVGQYG